MSGVFNPSRLRYQYVPPGQTNVVLGTNGGPGDYLARLIFIIDAPGTASVTLSDGPLSIPIMVGHSGIARGVNTVELGIASANGPWKITTAAGAGVIAVGQTGI